MSLEDRCQQAADFIELMTGVPASVYDGVVFVDTEFVNDDMKGIADKHSVIILPTYETDQED